MTPKKRLEAQKRFLEAFPDTGTIMHAAAAAGIRRKTHYEWLKIDPAYAELFAEAREEFMEALEAEMVRRARIGWDEPVYYQGELVGKVRRFSDTLAIFLAKANNPAKYRETIRNEISGPDGQTLPIIAEVNLVKAKPEPDADGA